MRCTQEGIQLIKDFEGCSLVAYPDGGGILTIGWGRARGVMEGETCSQSDADAWLLQDISDFERLILNCLQNATVTDNQLSALDSLVYNVGFGKAGVKDGFAQLKEGGPSTLLKCLLAADIEGAAAEFPKWCKVGGVPNDGILRRRMAEQALFNKPESGE